VSEPSGFGMETESTLAAESLLTAVSCGCRGLKWMSRRAVHIERRKRRDLVHVGIQDTNGRCISAPTGREPHGAVFRELDLWRVRGELRFWMVHHSRLRRQPSSRNRKSITPKLQNRR
jgi:hypothetical protein